VATDEDTTDGDTTDPEEYNIRSEERVELLIELQGLINNASVSSTLWALCQLCDLTKLSLIRDISKIDPKYLHRFEPNLIFIPLLCKLPVLRLVLTIEILTISRDPEIFTRLREVEA